MAVIERRFKQGFLWGTAASAYQIEGACAEGGRGESIWDRFCRLPGAILGGDSGARACDHYHRMEEDLDLMARLGLTAYRFSIAWPRILPQGWGRPNPEGIDFYRRLVRGLRERGIEPLPTLFHWDLPVAVHDAGGWLNRRSADWFADYAAVCAEELGPWADRWITLNEPTMATNFGYRDGIYAPGVKDEATALQVFHQMLVAHGRAARRLKKASPGLKVGVAPALSMHYAATDTPADRRMADFGWDRHEGWQLGPLLQGAYPEAVIEHYMKQGVAPDLRPEDCREICAPLDFIGVNYYTSHVHHAGAEDLWHTHSRGRTPLGWHILPQGFTEVLRRVHSMRPELPIFITENGMGSNAEPATCDGPLQDLQRQRFLADHLNALLDAIGEGIEVDGYCVWSLLDNFEWNLGYSARFGLVHVDYTTFKRTPKASAQWYAETIRRNAVAPLPAGAGEPS